MTDDHYATLGVAPKSEAVAIRAAYLALMRLHHPDKNQNPAAVERAQAVIAAFAVLGDSEKRLHYDWDRRRAAEAAALPPRALWGKMPRSLIAFVVSALVLVPYLLMRSPLTEREPLVVPTATGAEVGIDPMQVTEVDAVAAPIAAVAPVAAQRREAVVEPIAIDRAAAEPRLSENQAPPVSAPALRLSLPPREQSSTRTAVAAAKPPVRANPRCRFVQPGAETAICNNDNLAALDRNAVTFYNQSLSFGDAAKRVALLGSRDNFLARRNACLSNDCLTSVHLTHMREISAIAENRSPEPPR